MKCYDVRQTLIAYLDNEVTPREQEQIQEHIARCADCQIELVTLRGLQSHMNCALQAEAAQVAPSAGAWERLRANLAVEPINSPSNGNGLLHRLGLLGSNHKETYRKNKPASTNMQSWSVFTNGWHKKLILATRWPIDTRVNRRLKQGFIFKNKCEDEAENDDVLK